MEIEKKYRLTVEQRDRVLRRLREVGADDRGDEFEENTIYGGGALKRGSSVLRLRRVGSKAVLTYKERLPGTSATKQQREEETVVEDPEATATILEALGFTRVLVYEKRRHTWRLERVEVVVDELPFGLFMEIEGDEDSIDAAERLLEIESLTAEHSTYPKLTEERGRRSGDVIEARFRDD